VLAPIVVRDASIKSGLDGVVGFGRDAGARRTVTVTPERDGVLRTDEARTFLVPKTATLSVHAGDHVAKGRSLTSSRPAFGAGVKSLEAARLNDEPTLDKFVAFGSDETDARPRSAGSADRRREAREAEDERKVREETDAAHARRAEERRARRETAADLAEVREGDDTKARARRLVASVDGSRPAPAAAKGTPATPAARTAPAGSGPLRSA
jgi:hypothetical protein